MTYHEQPEMVQIKWKKLSNDEDGWMTTTRTTFNYADITSVRTLLADDDHDEYDEALSLSSYYRNWTLLHFWDM